jgi:hypothetical protein
MGRPVLASLPDEIVQRTVKKSGLFDRGLWPVSAHRHPDTGAGPRTPSALFHNFEIGRLMPAGRVVRK